MKKPKLFCKFKNQFGKEFRVFLSAPPKKYNADGLCENPHHFKHPRIWIDPNLAPRRQLAVLIEEVVHAFFWEKKEGPVRALANILARMIVANSWEYTYHIKYDNAKRSKTRLPRCTSSTAKKHRPLKKKR